jgi:hypothetical protein
MQMLFCEAPNANIKGRSYRDDGAWTAVQAMIHRIDSISNRLTKSLDYVSDNLPRMKNLCVFCGSNFGTRPAYRASATKVGSLLAARGITLVYGGGKVGMMGALADACLSAGGRVIGIIPKSLAAKEIAIRISPSFTSWTRCMNARN